MAWLLATLALLSTNSSVPGALSTRPCTLFGTPLGGVWWSPTAELQACGRMDLVVAEAGWGRGTTEGNAATCCRVGATCDGV